MSQSNPSNKSPMQGHATEEGTRRYSERANSGRHTAEGHFTQLQPEGLFLSSLGMGSYLGNADEETDTLVTRAVVDSALSGAVNVIDTAINYRFQKAERSIGTAVQKLVSQGIQRDELFICSKNGYLAPDVDAGLSPQAYIQQEILDTGVATPQDFASGSHCMTPKYLDHQLNRSLQNLGLETLDLMYLHNAAEAQLPAVGRDEFLSRLFDAFTFLEEARQQNRIRFYGLATWDCFRVEPSEATSYLNLETVVNVARDVAGNSHGFRFVQLPFNLAFTEAGSLENQTVNGKPMTFLEAAHQLKIGVFTSVPLLQGQLLEHDLPRFEGLSTGAQNCLQLARSHPGIIAPLVGHKHPDNVEENLQVARVSPLAPEKLNEQLAAF